MLRGLGVSRAALPSNAFACLRNPQPSPAAPATTSPTNAVRWTRVKAMFELAVTLESSEWPSFLDIQCGSDEELRREVESLLLAHEHSSNFLEEPVMSAGALADFTEGPPEASRFDRGGKQDRGVST